MKELQTTRKGRLMVGQAGVFRAASMLLFQGHVPSFPSVDTGVDILLDNGLRLQVKSRHLMSHPAYPEGAYPFSMKENNRNGRRDWTGIVDFLIFWGIDEDRYFIVPAAEATHNFWIRPALNTRLCASVSAMQTLREKGMTYEEIGSQLGVSRNTVSRNLGKPSKYNSPKGNRHLASYEDRWDLLNISQALQELESQVLVKEL